MSDISLLIVEDEIELMSFYYDQAIDVFEHVYVASTMKEARMIIKNEWVDGLFLDNYLPDGRGLSLLNEIYSENYHYPSIVVTAVSSSKNLHKAINKSVLKFIDKPIRLNKLTTTLHLLKRHIKRTKRDIDFRSRNEVTVNAARNLADQYNLSEREIEVIKYSLRVKNNTELAQKLYIAHGTIKRHWQNIFNKTQLRSRDEITDLVSRSNILSYREV